MIFHFRYLGIGLFLKNKKEKLIQKFPKLKNEKMKMEERKFLKVIKVRGDNKNEFFVLIKLINNRNTLR